MRRRRLVGLCHDACVGTGQHDVLRVSTADNVGIGYDIAGLGSRFIAQLLDSLVVGVIALVVEHRRGRAVDPPTRRTRVLAGLAAAGVTLLVYVGYFTICEVSTGGRTPGKSAGQLRVLDSPAPRPPPDSCCCATWPASSTSSPGVGVVVMFWNRQSRRIGDLLAGTVVVRVRPRCRWRRSRRRRR